ncbi:MAG: CinA family nicotinamide mononucleotide deamidase-related protein [bacterium]|nr:CinA family nicotinamide mononucleotide deamidase-related protein [bacterium]
MEAYIIGIGNELLRGATINTNAVFIAQDLIRLGIKVKGILNVGDNIEDIVDSLRFATKEAEFVIITGGLGPTHDDLTREAISLFTGLPLLFSDEAFENVKEYFFIRNRPLGPGSPKEAFIPKGGEVLKNSVGVASGFWIKHNGKNIIVLPGVPREAKAIWEDTVRKRLESLYLQDVPYFTLRVFGLGESMVESKILDIIKENRSSVDILIGEPLEIKLFIKGERAKELFEKIKERLEDYIFTYNDETLVEVVIKKLKEKALTLATAESCTGGLLAERLTSVPGSSTVFKGGFVPYSYWAKKMLGIPSYIFDMGNVSLEMAENLARIARERLSADIGIGITGNAGPTAGDTNKPVGYVCISIVRDDSTISRDFQLEGDRARVRFLAVQWALDMLRRSI